MLNLFKKKEETPADKAIRITKIAQSRIVQKHVDCILESMYSSADKGYYNFTLFKTDQIEKYWCQISAKLLELGFKFNHIGKKFCSDFLGRKNMSNYTYTKETLI